VSKQENRTSTENHSIVGHKGNCLFTLHRQTIDENVLCGLFAHGFQSSTVLCSFEDRVILLDTNAT